MRVETLLLYSLLCPVSGTSPAHSRTSADVCQKPCDRSCPQHPAPPILTLGFPMGCDPRMGCSPLLKSGSGTPPELMALSLLWEQEQAQGLPTRLVELDTLLNPLQVKAWGLPTQLVECDSALSLLQ
ncbi:uncharacterized protein LOC141576968 [Camelus bactrianus]|uniref:Uncharacterized protein LOC141576968 n=1 Tax=Camelus bactrianus TaxID=9837 RepID=A0AC58Q294_CAMBA